jgi:polyphosphate kinase 2
VALGKPSERDQSVWYFQRWVPYLPAAEELVLFNRSWYNRAGVERVMGFCTPEQVEQFLNQVGDFERMLVQSGIRLFKYYLDISKAVQAERLAERRKDPLKQWKISPIDAVALRHWKKYSHARDEMLKRSHTAHGPWTVVDANKKRRARIAVIRDLLARSEYDGKRKELLRQDPRVLTRYDPKRAKTICYC